MTTTASGRSEEHTSELQSLRHLVCRLLLEKKDRVADPPRRSLRRDSRQPQASALRHARPGREEHLERAGVADPPRRSLRRDYRFFNDTATTEIYPLSLHDALPI